MSTAPATADVRYAYVNLPGVFHPGQAQERGEEFDRWLTSVEAETLTKPALLDVLSQHQWDDDVSCTCGTMLTALPHEADRWMAEHQVRVIVRDAFGEGA